MRLADVLAISNDSREDLLYRYWDIELDLAFHNEQPLSTLDMRDPKWRTCAICGHVSPTSETGGWPTKCDNARCQALREFWGVHNGVCSTDIGYHRRHKSAVYRQRAEFLRKRIGALSGQRALEMVDPSLRFDFLLNAMLERIVHEHRENDRRTA